MSPDPDPLLTSAFDYALPTDLIAHHPATRRDESRLLLLDRATGRPTHATFRDIVQWFAPGDVLVLNETRVMPARLIGMKTTGARAEVLLLKPVPAEDGVWEALVRPGSKLRRGAVVVIADDLSVEIIGPANHGARRVRIMTDLPFEEALELHGRVPLPPYIDREATPEDRERYQTVYARTTGSVAAPTAGLHFTPSLLAQIEAAGVTIARLLLHVGPGTFRPVGTDDPADHDMHTEEYNLPEEVVDVVRSTRSAGGRVWAVGTTVVRTLETATSADGAIRSGSGTTSLFIRPGYRFRTVDRLITNFHLPRSTLLMLVCAFAGHEAVMAAYGEAVRLGYRFYSYGDAMAIL